MIGSGRPLLRKKIGGFWHTGLQNADFRFILGRSASAVTPNEKQFN